MKEIWNKIGISKEIEQCLADQARMLRVNGSLTDVEIRRKCAEEDWHLDENGQEHIRDQTEEQNNQN